MTATPLVRSAALSPSPLAALLSRLRRHLDSVEAAHDRQARLAALMDEDQRDLGQSREDIAGVPRHEPALPFFLQRRSER